MKRELVGGHFVQLFISSLNHLNTAYMKGKNSNILAYCGFIPLMSSATRNLLWLVCLVNTAYILYLIFK